MKRIILFLVLVLISYAVFHDLTKGTLPLAVEVSKLEKLEEPLNNNFFEKRVERGETVLTIVEEYLQGPLPVSIDQLIADFERLNEGTKASHIIVGKIYKFPKYALEKEE